MIDITKLTELGNELPILLKRFGKDGKYVEAFALDFQDAVKKVKKPEEVTALFTVLTIVVLKAQEGARDFKVYSPNTWDVFKKMRIFCDDVAKASSFERYKKLRNL